MTKEILNTDKQLELFEHNKPYIEENRRLLNRILDEFLADKDKTEILSDAFLWRLLQQYNTEMGFKFIDQAEVSDFFDKDFRPAVEELLKQRGITEHKPYNQPSTARKRFSRPQTAEQNVEELHWTERLERKADTILEAKGLTKK